jgi:hypothetical protein
VKPFSIYFAVTPKINDNDDGRVLSCVPNKDFFQINHNNSKYTCRHVCVLSYLTHTGNSSSSEAQATDERDENGGKNKKANY